jgi:hypothetical protein
MPRLSVWIVLMSGLTLCCYADEGKDESGKGKKRADAQHGQDDDRGSYFHRRGYTRLNIPPGHYPPPGECRIWFPGRPPGQQPPPGNCRQLSARVPPGAWLIRHRDDDLEHVLVDVYDERRPGKVLVVGQFKMGSGVFVRVVVDK